MNINSNELLLLKKVKFGEEATRKSAGITTNVTEPVETLSPQATMNALNFQGLNNVTSNPELATELKMMNEDVTSQEVAENAEANENAEQSNVSFQARAMKMSQYKGKTSTLKSMAFSALMALGMLGSTATLQSCDDKEVVYVPGSNETTVTVNVDMTAITAIFQQMQMMWQQMLEQQKITNEQMQKNNEFMQKLITLYQQGNENANEFYSKMYNFMMTSTANQDVIINLLEQNGMSQEEANKLLKELIQEVKDGKTTAAEAWEKIVNLLGDIKGILGQVLTSLQKAEQDRAELKEIANDIRNSSYVSNEQQAKLIAQNDSLIASNKLAISKLEVISNQIEKANLDSNANFDRVVNTLNMSKSELINVMMKLGYTQAQIEKMTAAQIIKAIKENTAATKNNTTRLEEINNEIKDGKIDAKEAANKIIELLGEINNNILTLTDSFNNFVKDYKSDKNKAMRMLAEIIKNGRVQTSMLASLNKTQKDMASNIAGIKANTDALLEIAQDDTKYNELMKTLKEIQAGGSGSIDYEKFEQMFKLLNMNLTDVIKMSRSELVAAIKDFENTYVQTEQKQTEELQTIQAKIDDLQIFISNNNNKDIINAINKLSQTINKGNADVTEELKNIEAQLNKLQAIVNAILKSIGEQAARTDVYYQKWDTKFNDILSRLDGFKSQLNTIIANQKTAQIYLSNLQKEVENLKVEIKNIQNQGGTGVDYNKLEEMWKEHDKANYDKYSKLIKDLGIDTSKLKTVEDLLKSIDSKMDNIKDNSDILTKILNKLNGIDFSKPDYSSKLDKIIELLEKFKHNCNCGNNNEGILGELDKILG